MRILFHVSTIVNFILVSFLSSFKINVMFKLYVCKILPIFLYIRNNNNNLIKYTKILKFILIIFKFNTLNIRNLFLIYF